MSRRFLVLLAVLAAVVVAPVPQDSASASCAGPSIGSASADVRIVLDRGATASVQGERFVDGCRDSMGCSGAGGCSRCEYADPPEKPLQDVVLELRQHGRTWRLDSADAGTAEENRLGRVTWTFEVPRALRPGRARLVTDGAAAVLVRVR